MRLFSILAAGAAVVAAVPAAAQTEDNTGFNGFYIAGSVSADVQNNDIGERVVFDRNLNGTFNDTVLTGAGANAFSPGFCNGAARGTTPGAGCRNDKDDMGYSVRIGLDSQRGRLVFGAVGEFGKSEIRDSVTAFSTTPAAYVFTREIDWEATIRARAGYTPNDSTLFYGTFGPSYAKIDSSYRQTQVTNSFTGRGDRRQWGITGGGGVEQKITRNITFGLEYMHHRYSDDDFRVRLAGPAGTPFTNAANGGTATGTDLARSDNRFQWHSIRATAGFRF